MIDRDMIAEMPIEKVRELALSGDIILATKRGVTKLSEVIQTTRDEITHVQLEMGQAAKDDPDLPENTTFKELKTRLQFELPKKLNDLKNNELKVIEFNEDNTEAIGFGTLFEVDMYYADTDEKEKERFILLGPIEAMYMKSEYPNSTVISYLTPIGKQLWGKPFINGTSYLINTPQGQIKCTIRRRND